MPRTHSGPPTSADRSTEPRIVAASAPATAAVREEASQEDFLFHLYRGSELLQDNRVLDAKEELEFALTMQPADPKGQDLLGTVYFRLGLYPRAIQIYETLQRSFPNDTSIKVNLALAYLKTGQPEPARYVLQEAVRIQPEHKRAWGYLGLSLQKLGELEQAKVAFERGGHAMMVKRVAERIERGRTGTLSDNPSTLDEGVRSVAETAFSELDGGNLRFSLAEPERTPSRDGTWHMLEIGHASPSVPAPAPAPATDAPPPWLPEGTTTAQPPPVSTRLVPPPMAGEPPRTTNAPSQLEGTPPSLLFASAEGPAVAVHASGVVVVRVGADPGLAARLDALRIVSGPLAARVLHRRVRGNDTSEIFGGVGAPFVVATGNAQAALGARPGYRLSVIALDDEIAFVREEALIAFELRLAYENGRIALDHAGDAVRSEAAPVAQLRGGGAVVVESPREPIGVPCKAGTPLLVRREWIVAWLGRLVPRALPSTESPGGQRGLVSFAGEGTVLVCPS